MDLRPFLSRLSSDATLDLIAVLKKELRRYEPRSRFPKKPPFRAHFRAFYPHPAHKSSLKAEWATHFLAPGKRGWSPPSPGHCSPASTLHAPRQTSGVRSCAKPPPLATACHRQSNWQRPNGARSRRAAPYFQYVTEPGNSYGQINPFLPTRRRPIVNHFLVAGGAQRQGLQTCRPDAHQPEWPVLSLSPKKIQCMVGMIESGVYDEAGVDF